MSTVIKVNEAEVFSASPVSKSPDSKIPILSAAKRRQKVTKLDLLGLMYYVLHLLNINLQFISLYQLSQVVKAKHVA